jgi:hypothetical protein
MLPQTFVARALRNLKLETSNHRNLASLSEVEVDLSGRYIVNCGPLPIESSLQT